MALTSIAAGLVVVATVGLLAFLSDPRPSELPPPMSGEAILSSPGLVEPAEQPTVSYSPAPVSLSSRATPPSRSPSHRPRPSSRPASPKPSAGSPQPPSTAPRPRELTPLPPSEEPNLRSAGGGPETFIDFANARSEPAVVHWLDYGGQRRQYAVLQPGEGYRQQTYVGHPWVVTTVRGVGLVCFLPDHRTLRAVVR
ncbi:MULTISPECIES: hypothetical protein [Micromonospora]|uniref:VHL beta domain-containing protein n=1 Tax=Micromonospora TaxID=1873 RepID=UPI001F2DB3AF|nr:MULTISPECIES: hypothetical protein [Micromonospora]